MPGLVAIFGEFSKASKKEQPRASSTCSSLESARGYVSRQRDAEEKKNVCLTMVTPSESEATICMLLMDRFAPS